MTIKEVARLAGVSPAAVSRYLNGGPLSKDKKERVAQAIEETGYRPNLMAKTMRTGKVRQVGVIVPRIMSESVNSLMDAVYNSGSNLSIILDNRITGMTGHQQNPGTGYTLMGKEAPEVDIPALCKAIGVKDENIITVNPNHLDEVEAALDKLLGKDEPTVLITRWPCVLKKFSQQDIDEFPTLHKTQCVIDQDKCKNCKMCVKTGCPALISTKEKVVIDKTSCNGCTVCKQVCPFKAIEEVTR